MLLSNANSGIWKQSRWIKLRQSLKGDKKTLNDNLLYFHRLQQKRAGGTSDVASILTLTFHLRPSLHVTFDSYIKDPSNTTCQSSGVTQAPSRACPGPWRAHKKRGCHLGTLKLRKRKGRFWGKEQRAHSTLNLYPQGFQTQGQVKSCSHTPGEQPGQLWKRFRNGKVLIKEWGSVQLNYFNRDNLGQWDSL